MSGGIASYKPTGLQGPQILQPLSGISVKMKENICRSFADIGDDLNMLCNKAKRSVLRNTAPIKVFVTVSGNFVLLIVTKISESLSVSNGQWRGLSLRQGKQLGLWIKS
jgi:hypothetical protein